MSTDIKMCKSEAHHLVSMGLARNGYESYIRDERDNGFLLYIKQARIL